MYGELVSLAKVCENAARKTTDPDIGWFKESFWGLENRAGGCVSRLQHAVGHGGFHTGHIQIFEPPRTGAEAAAETEIESFRYVYDCGSEQSEAFKSQLNAHRLSSNGRTDILFVSHLHSDHINGIERLQAMAPAEMVVVPYLDAIERLIFILADTESGAISTSAREYFGNPANWWLNRGARYVIFLEADDGDAPQPDRPAEPDGPVDGDDGGFDRRLDAAAWQKEKGPAARLAHHLRKPRGTVPDGLTAAKRKRMWPMAPFLREQAPSFGSNGAATSTPVGIMSVEPGEVGAETFAAVTPRNNGKLAADLAKLARRSRALSGVMISKTSSVAALS
ncbi:MBL fold metallo-hydrolase [Mesorhizobium sp. M1005]|uniref:MBL fold metallo-hydrolase n=1 Tax=unclassified Mesorhizobium TaxID=325217 RepID=UPI003334FECB